MATTKPKILLVDDVDFFLDVEMDFLARTPVEILTAGNGADALRLIRQERPQLVYLDVTLPDIDGAECCRRIKDDPYLRLTPVILVFASSKDLSADAMEQYGCDDVLAKPLERKVFLNCGYRFLFGVERRNKRVRCQTPIHCRFEHDSLESNVVDINVHGVYVQSRMSVLPGTTLTVSFKLPAIDTAIEGRARVAWVNQGAQRNNLNLPQGFGVQLLQIPTAAQSVLTDFVNTAEDPEETRYENNLLTPDRPKAAPLTSDQQQLLPHDSKKESGWTEH